jgi:hypothetical protein
MPEGPEKDALKQEIAAKEKELAELKEEIARQEKEDSSKSQDETTEGTSKEAENIQGKPLEDTTKAILSKLAGEEKVEVEKILKDNE